MARSYSDIGVEGFKGPPPKWPIYASDLNNVREAISRRATISGATVTLPDILVATDPVGTDFEKWLLAARTAIEDITTTEFFLTYAPGVWSPWSISTLLGYVNSNWAPIVPGTDWASYTKPGFNRWFVRYINQIYFALECLCFHGVASSEKSNVAQIKTGTGSDGNDGGDPLVDGTETVNSDTQGGNFGAAVSTGSVNVVYANLDFSVWMSCHDDGVGGWIVDSSEGCSLLSGSVTYSSGVWTMTTDYVFPAGGMMITSATLAAVVGDWDTAIAAAWVDFAAQSYGATGATWEAKGYLHLYAVGNIKYAVVENTKVTDAQATVPSIAYDDIELYFPYQKEYMPISPEVTLSVGSIVGQIEVFPYRYVGYLRVLGSFSAEDVQLGPYYFDITSSNFYGIPPCDGACTFEVSPTGAYGRCGFDGYLNGAYQPPFP